MSLLPGLSIVVDQNGNLLAGTIGQVPPTTNAMGATTSQTAGVLQAGLNPAGKLTALLLDSTGALATVQSLQPTATVCSNATVGTGTASGKSMLSIYNASTTLTRRILAVNATCPPQAGLSSGLLGTSTTYTQIFFGAYRMTGHSGGTALSFVSHDPADDAAFDSTLTARFGATVTGLASSASYQWDAGYNARLSVGTRQDPYAKVWTMPPSSGISIQCLTTVSTSVGFLMTATVAQASS